MYCTKCNMPVVSGKFCGVCGGKLIEATVDCPHSTEIYPHQCFVWDRFCKECGKPVQEEMNNVTQIKGEEDNVSTNS